MLSVLVRRAVGALAVAATVVAGAVTTASVAAADVAPVTGGTPSTVSAQALPTVQINGVVWNQQIVGNRVYVGGNFTTARPAGAAVGTNEVPRTYLLAYDLTTGVLVDSFAPSLDGQVKDLSLSPDGSTLYAVGDFTRVNGVAEYRVAAFDAVTGALKTGFVASANGPMKAVVATSSAVYVVGTLTSVNGVARTGIAAVDPKTGAVLPFHATPAGGTVLAVTALPDGSQVMVGGSFTSMNGSSNPGYGLARFSSDGTMLPLGVNSTIRNAGSSAAIMDLETDGTNVYGAGYRFSSNSGIEGTFATPWSTGALLWLEDCHGDSYGLYPVSGVVYTASHKHYCGNSGGFPQTAPWTYHRATATSTTVSGTNTADIYGYPSFGGTPKPELLYWFPDINTGTFTGQSQGPWTVTGNDSYVLYGGEFTQVNGTAQQGLVRFARTSVTPSTDGPVLSGASIKLAATSTVAGEARVTWAQDWDRDDETLTYELYRGTATDANLIWSKTVTTPFWNTTDTPMSFVDTGLTPGSSQRYRMKVVDAEGNAATSDFATVTVAAAPTTSSYSNTVQVDQPTSYWRLGDAAGSSTAQDWQGANAAKAGSGVAFGTPGAVGDGSTAATFTGTSSGLVAGSTQVTAPQVFSVEAWFKTTSMTGGKIVGFGSASSGSSATCDRHLYMLMFGKVAFGVYPGTQKVITSTRALNDGQWHHVVGTLGPAGQALYVDGQLVGQDPTTTSAQSYAGYWRIGGDSTWSGAQYLRGTIDEAAVYPTALSAAQVARHYAVGTGVAVPNQAPTASFTASAALTSLTFNGTGSTDADGWVRSYAWSFGDGGTATGGGASHTYTKPGTYQVTLTVTDDKGATGTVTQAVTVQSADQPPVAAFTASVSGRAVSVDGSGSSDPDGSVVSYAWDFGDGSSGSGVSADHTYASDGVYPVTLTVTDNAGATSQVSRSVVVSTSAPASLAGDSFSRSVSGGWGAADAGGAWTVSGGNGRFSVNGTTGLQTLPAGYTTTAVLSSVSSTSTDAQVTITADKVPGGGGAMLYLQGRRAANGDVYATRVKLFATGAVELDLQRPGGSVGGTVAGLTFSAGDKLHVRMQVDGTSPTTLRAKIWKDGQPEPTAWAQTFTDSTASLQSAGAVGLSTYLSASAANGPVAFGYDDLVVTAAG